MSPRRPKNYRRPKKSRVAFSMPRGMCCSPGWHKLFWLTMLSSPKIVPVTTSERATPTSRGELLGDHEPRRKSNESVHLQELVQASNLQCSKRSRRNSSISGNHDLSSIFSCEMPATPASASFDISKGEAKNAVLRYRVNKALVKVGLEKAREQSKTCWGYVSSRFILR